MLFLVGGPSHIDTWDPKPKAPAEVRGPFQPIATNVPRASQISEIFPQDGEARRQVLAGPLGLPHGHGGPRHRPPDDADRPAVHRRRRAPARRLRARLPQGRPRRGARPTCCCRRPIGRTGGNLPHGQTAGYLGKQHDPFILNADPSAPGFKVPDLLPPDYISAVRAERRQKLRDAVDGAIASFEKSRGRQAARRQLQPRLPADVQPEGPRGVRPGEGAATRSATATAGRASASAA